MGRFVGKKSKERVLRRLHEQTEDLPADDVVVEGEEGEVSVGDLVDTPERSGAATLEELVDVVDSLGTLIHNAVNDILDVLKSVVDMKDIELEKADEVIAGLKDKISGSLSVLETCVEQLLYLLGADVSDEEDGFFDEEEEDEDDIEFDEEDFEDEEEELEEFEPEVTD